MRSDLGQPLDLKEAISRLAQPGYRVVIEDQGGHDGYRIWIKRTEGIEISNRELSLLIEDGWLKSYGAQGGYELSDVGRAAYIRSTDELQDGRLIPPSASSAEAKHE